MYSTLVSLAIFSSLALAASAELTIDTPTELVQCQPVHVTWKEGAAPFDLIVTPTEDPCNQVLADLGDDHKGQSITWTVDLPAGTQAMFSLVDANGAEAWSGAVTVKGSDNSACLPEALNAAVNASSSSAASASGSSSVADIATPATTLVVPPGSISRVASSAAPTSTSDAAVPVGAANAGLDPLGSGAAAFHKFSAPALAFSAIVAVVVSFAL
ncbi:unnamed protein product [Somion occarium]|uniref:Uncharacterized protein n=1 Tax=Somion occarium TaxID=3059160 RepID=A0ABP1EBT7_9APHY